MKTAFTTIAITALLILGVQSAGKQDVPQEAKEQVPQEVPKDVQKEPDIAKTKHTFNYKGKIAEIDSNETVHKLLQVFNIKVACGPDGQQLEENAIISDVWKEHATTVTLEQIMIYIVRDAGVFGTLKACPKSTGDKLVKLESLKGYEPKDFDWETMKKNKRAAPLYFFKPGVQVHTIIDRVKRKHYVPFDANDTEEGLKNKIHALGIKLKHPVFGCKECIMLCKDGAKVTDLKHELTLESSYAFFKGSDRSKVAQVCRDESLDDLKTRLYVDKVEFLDERGQDLKELKGHLSTKYPDHDVKPIMVRHQADLDFFYEIDSKPENYRGVCKYTDPKPKKVTGDDLRNRLDRDLALEGWFKGVKKAFYLNYALAQALCESDKEADDFLVKDRKLTITSQSVTLNIKKEERSLWFSKAWEYFTKSPDAHFSYCLSSTPEQIGKRMEKLFKLEEGEKEFLKVKKGEVMVGSGNIKVEDLKAVSSLDIEVDKTPLARVEEEPTIGTQRLDSTATSFEGATTPVVPSIEAKRKPKKPTLLVTALIFLIAAIVAALVYFCCMSEDETTVITVPPRSQV
jgi:hypothetical protein